MGRACTNNPSTTEANLRVCGPASLIESVSLVGGISKKSNKMRQVIEKHSQTDTDLWDICTPAHTYCCKSAGLVSHLGTLSL